MTFKDTDEILSFLRPYADAEKVEIIEISTDAKAASLTVYIDCDGGVDLDTCERFHNAVMDPIDGLDPSYGSSYTLNVSSPGLDRPFKTDRDFEKNLGGDVELKLFAPYRGKKFYEGTMTAYDANSVTVMTASGEIKFPKNKIAKINKAIKFDI